MGINCVCSFSRMSLRIVDSSNPYISPHFALLYPSISNFHIFTSRPNLSFSTTSLIVPSLVSNLQMHVLQILYPLNFLQNCQSTQLHNQINGIIWDMLQHVYNIPLEQHGDISYWFAFSIALNDFSLIVKEVIIFFSVHLHFFYFHVVPRLGKWLQYYIKLRGKT